ncbi:MAG TPA: DUF2461 domain-containing protein [Spirochaetota bacterium]|nr:DUF2461 domain-containing protein [Spirochaetota bacterium]HRZ27623.1 DUF2461 domain-containing protein [Spirochaetota bacterium]HSA13507.1 DUF2461 domain-containing protein [Spirochaetota bacterium]
MIKKSTLDFLKGLGANNNREWFKAHRADYDRARADFELFLGCLISLVAKFDPPVGRLAPEDCMFRIYRDTRFSRDKTPYKTNFGAVLSPGGNRMSPAGYYVHIEPGSCMAGGGIYHPDPEVLYRVRQKIDREFTAFRKIITGKSFTKYFDGIHGDALVNVPRGFDKESPAADYLKFKDLYSMALFSNKEALADDFTVEVAKRFRAVKKLNDFFRDAM